MNPAHLHLVTNHIPVIGALGILLILLYAFLTSNASIKKLAYFLMILLSLATVVAYKSGDGAEHLLERLPGVSEQLIEAHEEAAEPAFIVLEVTGFLALLALLFSKKESLAKILSLLVLLGTLASSALMGYAAKLGGEIRHPEVRSDFQVPAASATHDHD